MQIDSFELAEFAKSSSFQDPLHIDGFESGMLFDALIQMVRIRAVETKLASAKRDGLIGGPVHLGVGQEAIAVGVSRHLRNSDRVFGAHRSHSHLLALGSDIHRLFSEILGRSTGHSRGMGGSMHLWDQSVGFYGSVPIVAGTVPLAVGAAMSARLSHSTDVSVAYFGDGACEEGVVHESLNLASIQRDPIIFVVENNLFASHMHISLRQPKNSTARFAAANGIPFSVVDGNDITAVDLAASQFVAAAREGKGPGFIEAITYRWYGHVDWREDIDVGVNRSQQEIDQWRLKDPIRRLKDALILNNLFSEGDYLDLLLTTDKEIEQAWSRALADPFPLATSTINCVFSN